MRDQRCKSGQVGRWFGRATARDLARASGAAATRGHIGHIDPIASCEQLEQRQLLTTVFAVTDNNLLLQFDSATPAIIERSTPITGLGFNERIASLDYKPGTGGGSPTLFGVASGNHTPFYTIDPQSGVATRFAPGLAGGFPLSYAVGFDYDDLSNTFRYTDELGGSYRFSGDNLFDFTNTAGISGLTDVAFRSTGGDSSQFQMVGVLYNTDEFAVINAANGALISHGTLGIDVDKWVGLDFSPDGTPLLSVRTGGVSRLGTISSGDGHTFIDMGTIGDGTAIIRGLTADPTPQAAPTINTAIALTLGSINEDATGGDGVSISSLISSGGGDLITDPNPGALEGIALTGADQSHGVWQYALDGSTWQDVGTVTDDSALLLPADGTARVRFIPEHDYHGDLTQALRFRAWDQTGAGAGERVAIGPGGNSSGFSLGSAFASLTVLAVADPAAISRGPALPIEVTEKQFALPFAAFVITYNDDESRVLTTTISIDPTRGTFTTESLASSGFVANSNGTSFVFAGTAAQATAAARLLAYKPLENIAPIGTQTLSILTITVDDALAGPTQVLSPFITSLSVNDAPTITGLDPTPFSITDRQTTTVFINLTFDDAESASQTLTVDVTIPAGAGGFTPESLTASGFTAIDAATFRFIGTAAAATTAVRQLVFKPLENFAAPNSVTSVTISLNVSDGLATANGLSPTINVTSVNDAPTIAGIITSNPVKLSKTIKAFRRLIVGDVDGGDSITATVKFSKPAKGTFTALSLRDSGFVRIANGKYRFTGTAAAAQAALRKLAYKFNAAVGTTPTTVKMTLTVADSAGATINNGQTGVSLKL